MALLDLEEKCSPSIKTKPIEMIYNILSTNADAKTVYQEISQGKPLKGNKITIMPCTEEIRLVCH